MEEVAILDTETESQIVADSCTATVLAAVDEMVNEITQGAEPAVKIAITQAVVGTLDAVQDSFHLVPKIEYVDNELRERAAPEAAETGLLSAMMSEFWTKAAG